MEYTTIRIKKETLFILNKAKGFWTYRDDGKKWAHDDVLNWLLSTELQRIDNKERD